VVFASRNDVFRQYVKQSVLKFLEYSSSSTSCPSWDMMTARSVSGIGLGWRSDIDTEVALRYLGVVILGEEVETYGFGGGVSVGVGGIPGDDLAVLR